MGGQGGKEERERRVSVDGIESWKAGQTAAGFNSPRGSSGGGERSPLAYDALS